MEPTNDELKERIALLERLKELRASIPDEDEIQLAKDHLATLQAIDAHDGVDEDDAKAASDHLATLCGIEEHSDSMPDEDEMNAAKEHLATLCEIKDREAA
jgi:hypothetical protein